MTKYLTNKKNIISSLHAYTLIEVLIVLSISVILVSISSPLLNQLMTADDDKRFCEGLLFALDTTKQLAQQFHMPMVLCPSKNGKDCSENWLHDRIIFPATKSIILRKFFTTTSGGNIKWRSYPRYRKYVVIHGDPMNDSDNGTFWYCKKKGKGPEWAIILSKAGQYKVLDREQLISSEVAKSLVC